MKYHKKAKQYKRGVKRLLNSILVILEFALCMLTRRLTIDPSLSNN